MDKAYVIVTRHPDFGNEYATFGEVDCIDIDLGSSFDIGSAGEPDRKQIVEWAAGYWYDNDLPYDVLETVRSIVLQAAMETAGDLTEHEMRGLIMVEAGWEPSDTEKFGAGCE